MYFKTGTRQRTRYVDISAVSAKLPEGMCDLLPGLHALTGSDATSAFVGKGKTAAFQLVQNSLQLRQDLTSLGTEFEVTD